MWKQSRPNGNRFGNPYRDPYLSLFGIPIFPYVSQFWISRSLVDLKKIRQQPSPGHQSSHVSHITISIKKALFPLWKAYDEGGSPKKALKEQRRRRQIAVSHLPFPKKRPSNFPIFPLNCLLNGESCHLPWRQPPKEQKRSHQMSTAGFFKVYKFGTVKRAFKGISSKQKPFWKLF